MKKKIIAAALIAVMAFSLGGCSSSQTTKVSSEIQQANPWTECDTLDAAEEAVGFTIEISSDIEFKQTTYQVYKGMNLIEIQDADGNYVRKAKDDGDISGDFNEYDYSDEVTVGDIKATVKGASEDSVNLITWKNGQYSYAWGDKNGVSASDVETIVKGVQ